MSDDNANSNAKKPAKPDDSTNPSQTPQAQAPPTSRTDQDGSDGPVKPNGLGDWGQPLQVTIPPPLADFARTVMQHKKFAALKQQLRAAKLGAKKGNSKGKGGNCNRNSKGKGGWGGHGHGPHGHGGKWNSKGRGKGRCSARKEEGKGVKEVKGARNVSLRRDEANGDIVVEMDIDLIDRKGQETDGGAKAGAPSTVVNAEKMVENETAKGAADASKNDGEAEESEKDNDADIPEWIKSQIRRARAKGDQLPPWLRNLLSQIDVGESNQTQQEVNAAPESKNDAAKDGKKDDDKKDEKAEDDDDKAGDDLFGGFGGWDFNGIPPWLRMGDIGKMFGSKEEREEMKKKWKNDPELRSKWKQKKQEWKKKMKDFKDAHKDDFKEAKREFKDMRKGRGRGPRGFGQNRGRGGPWRNSGGFGGPGQGIGALVGSLLNAFDIDFQVENENKEDDAGEKNVTKDKQEKKDEGENEAEVEAMSGDDDADFTQEELLQMFQMMKMNKDDKNEKKDDDKNAKKDI